MIALVGADGSGGARADDAIDGAMIVARLGQRLLHRAGSAVHRVRIGYPGIVVAIIRVGRIIRVTAVVVGIPEAKAPTPVRSTAAESPAVETATMHNDMATTSTVNESMAAMTTVERYSTTASSTVKMTSTAVAYVTSVPSTSVSAATMPPGAGLKG